MLKRTEESKLTSWYFEIDRRLLACLLIMFVIGLIWTVSAGSVVAAHIEKSWYFFAKKALPFYAIGLTTLFVSSMLNKKWVLRISAIDVATGLLLLAVTVVAPHIIKGSTRFVAIGPFNVMPADIMKPGFIIVTAWFLTKMHKEYGPQIFLNKSAWRFKWLGWPAYLAVFGIAFAIMFRHPDVGTSMLYFCVLVSMLIIAGLPLFILPIIGVFGAGLGVMAFLTMPHVHRRIIAFFTGVGDKWQIKHSVLSIQHGGLLGSGDDSFVKQYLPDAHTDFIFATIVEDVGALRACVVLGLLVYVLKRLTTDALNARDPFVFYATSGAAMLFATQVCINMMSTLNLFAPKGMTLPFISYGGSSFVSFCLLFGMILAIVREDKWK